MLEPLDVVRAQGPCGTGSTQNRIPFTARWRWGWRDVLGHFL